MFLTRILTAAQQVLHGIAGHRGGLVLLPKLISGGIINHTSSKKVGLPVRNLARCENPDLVLDIVAAEAAQDRFGFGGAKAQCRSVLVFPRKSGRGERSGIVG
jgi:hypothetical protein